MYLDVKANKIKLSRDGKLSSRCRFSGANTMKPSLKSSLLALALLVVSPPLAVLPPVYAAPAKEVTSKGEKTDKDNPPPNATDKEIEMGRKASQELEKDPKVKLLDDKKPENKALLEKLNKMAETLGKVSARPGIKYTVKVIDDKDINAFTLPNGQIYFYKGLIDLANSDDEIAAVMAHEIGHNSRLHALRGQAKARKLSWIGLATMAAALVGGGRDGAGIAQFSQYLLIGIMNGYGVDYEKEADADAVDGMAKTSYNPSALVTFMQRLGMEEKAHPEFEQGIFRTHPPSDERADAIKEQMAKKGIPYAPRDVTGGLAAKVTEKDGYFSVERAGVTLFELAFLPATKDAVKLRAEAAAVAVNNVMRDNLKLHELVAESSGNDARLMARNQEIVRCNAADAALQKTTPLDCAQKWRTNWSRLFWKEAVGTKS